MNPRPCHSSNHTAVVLSRVIVVHAQARLPIPPSPARIYFLFALQRNAIGGRYPRFKPGVYAGFHACSADALCRLRPSPSATPTLGMGSRAYARRRLRPRPGATEAALRAALLKVASGDGSVLISYLLLIMYYYIILHKSKEMLGEAGSKKEKGGENTK
jgi:hypothetical protein